MLRTRILNVFKAQGQKPPAQMGAAAVWLAQGYSPDLIAAVIADGLSRNAKIRSLKYFNAALGEAANGSADNLPLPPRPNGRAPPDPRKSISAALTKLLANNESPLDVQPSPTLLAIAGKRAD